jgi:hypothetical protein
MNFMIAITVHPAMVVHGRMEVALALFFVAVAILTIPGDVGQPIAVALSRTTATATAKVTLAFAY